MPVVDAKSIANYGFYLGDEARHSVPAIIGFAIDQGLNTEPFETSDVCLLKPIGEAIDAHGTPVMLEVMTEMQQKMAELGQGFVTSAKTWHGIDQKHADVFKRFDIDQCHPNDPNNDPAVASEVESSMYEAEADLEKGKYRDNSGVGSFGLTELRLKAPSRKEVDMSSKMKDADDRLILNALNWIWTTFKLDHKKNFEESILKPLVGDPGGMTANGEAWSTVETAIGDMAKNIGNNSQKLFAEAWDGKDAVSAGQHLSTFWTEGALSVMEDVAGVLAWAFKKAGDLVVKAVEACITGVKKLIVMLVSELASWADPFWGAMKDVAECIAKALHLTSTEDIFDKIKDAVLIGVGVVQCFVGAVKVIKGVKEMIKAVRKIEAAVQRIPKIKSDIADLADSHVNMAKVAADMNDDVSDEIHDVNQAKTWDEKAGKDLKSGFSDLYHGTEHLRGKTGDAPSPGDVADAIDAAHKAAKKHEKEIEKEAKGMQKGMSAPGAGAHW